MTSTLGLCALGLATGCEQLLSIHDPIAGDDGGGIDGGGIDGSVMLPPGSPILLSEVVVTPNEAEMIEIVNTSTDPVDLSTYYLSDSGNYYKLPADKTVDSTDFIVKFPVGATIAGHTALTVALDTPINFSTHYGVAPNFSLTDNSLEKISINGTPNLTNTGEPIILFQWDGHSDLVRDVDIMIVGMPTSANPFPSKSGVSQDGPDMDSIPSTYKTDAMTILGQSVAPGNGLSTQRIALEVGHETQNGTGNGPDGHDETSEDTSATWDGTQTNPFGPPTPGTPAPGLLK